MRIRAALAPRPERAMVVIFTSSHVGVRSETGSEIGSQDHYMGLEVLSRTTQVRRRATFPSDYAAARSHEPNSELPSPEATCPHGGPTTMDVSPVEPCQACWNKDTLLKRSVWSSRCERCCSAPLLLFWLWVMAQISWEPTGFRSWMKLVHRRW